FQFLLRHVHISLDRLCFAACLLAAPACLYLHSLGLSVETIDAIEPEDLVQPEICPCVIRLGSEALGRLPAGKDNTVSLRLTAYPLVVPNKPGCDMERAGRIDAFGFACNLGNVGFESGNDRAPLGVCRCDLGRSLEKIEKRHPSPCFVYAREQV